MRDHDTDPAPYARVRRVASSTRRRDAYAVGSTALPVERGVVRADLAGSDLPLLTLMVRAIADYTQDADPEAWRRVFTILLDGVRVHRTAPSPLPVGPLTPNI